jgi:hypothetical protein
MDGFDWIDKPVETAGSFALSGAQPPELFLKAFEQVAEATMAGEACEVDPAMGSGGVERRGLSRLRSADRCKIG